MRVGCSGGKKLTFVHTFHELQLLFVRFEIAKANEFTSEIREF